MIFLMGPMSELHRRLLLVNQEFAWCQTLIWPLLYSYSKCFYTSNRVFCSLFWHFCTGWNHRKDLSIMHMLFISIKTHVVYFQFQNLALYFFKSFQFPISCFWNFLSRLEICAPQQQMFQIEFQILWFACYHMIFPLKHSFFDAWMNISGKVEVVAWKNKHKNIFYTSIL